MGETDTQAISVGPSQDPESAWVNSDNSEFVDCTSVPSLKENTVFQSSKVLDEFANLNWVYLSSKLDIEHAYHFHDVFTIGCRKLARCTPPIQCLNCVDESFTFDDFDGGLCKKNRVCGKLWVFFVRGTNFLCHILRCLTGGIFIFNYEEEDTPN